MSFKSSAPGGAKPDKTMSSRLMSMKFMQRAAASTAQAQAVPDSDLASTNKRQKTDLWVVKAAVDQEQAKIEEALERHAVVPETKWVLSAPSVMPQVGNWHAGHLRVHETGYAEIENDVGPYRHSEMGRRSFGRFNRELEKRQKSAQGHSSSSSSGDASGASSEEDKNEDAIDDDPTNDLIREAKAKAERKAQQKEARAQADLMAEREKHKEIKLGKLTSISGGGGGLKKSGGPRKCYTCQQEGHQAKDCTRPMVNRRTYMDKNSEINL